MDEVTTKLGFVRWQWEYTRATYDYKMEDPSDEAVFYLRFNTRAIEGKLESPYAILILEEAYIGRATFPHGLDYASAIPQEIIDQSKRKLFELQKLLKVEQKVRDVLQCEFITLPPVATLHEAAVAMKDHQIDIIAVVDGKHLVGVVTDRDLAIRGYAEQQSEKLTIQDILSTEVKSVEPELSLEKAIKLMVKERLRGLPVVENGELIGILSLDDFAERNYSEYEIKQALGQNRSRSLS